MASKVRMTFSRLNYESLGDAHDRVGNRFAMVTDGLKISEYGPSPDLETDDNKVTVEFPTFLSDDLPRNETLKATLQLSQDPSGLTNIARGENVFKGKGFGFIIESRLDGDHAWIKTDTICEPFDHYGDGWYRNEVILKRVTLFPEMRIKVVVHPNVGGALQWLNGVGQGTPLDQLVKAQLWF